MANYVVVTTAHRGVFFGDLTEDGVREDKSCTLRNARNCIFWSASLKGYLGLAAYGPNKDCRIGPAVDRLDLYDVTSAAACTEGAVAKWEEAQ